MKAPVLRRRRVERYAQLLDEVDGVRHRHSRSPLDDDLSAMVALGARLADAAPDVAPREDWRRDTRALLMAAAAEQAAERAGAEAPARPRVVGRAPVGTLHESAFARRRVPRPRSAGSTTPPALKRRRIKLAVLAGLAIGTLTVSGISAASGGALPGDALYGMKRAAENAQIALGGSDTQKGNLYLQYAERRLSEAEQIAPDGDLVVATLNTMDTETRDGVQLLFDYALAHRDAKALATVDAFVNAQDNAVTTWAANSDLPDGLAQRLTASGVLLDRIRERSHEVATAVSCTSTPYTIATDDLGTEPGCRA